MSITQSIYNWELLHVWLSSREQTLKNGIDQRHDLPGAHLRQSYSQEYLLCAY